MFKNVSKEEIIVPAQMLYLRQVRDFIDFLGKKYKIDDKIVNSFKLVVDEACTNIIRHGYRDIKDGQITIRAIIRRRSVTIVIIDQGISFDPRQVRNPDLDKYVQIGKKGGLGIFMMRKLMDDIQYHVTSRGNELRLTKIREEVPKGGILLFWDSLTLRTKFSLVASLILTLLAIGSFFIFNARIQGNVWNEVVRESSSVARNLAEIAWDPLVNDASLALFQAAKSVQEAHSRMIEYALILNAEREVVAVYPVDYELVNKPVPEDIFIPREEQGELRIFAGVYKEKAIFNFSLPIQLTGVQTAPIGYAQIWVSGEYLNSQISHARTRLLIYIAIILAIGYLGIYLLVTFITEPFHRLAEWVRQVGRGTVDEDEIDIDSSDELGEIAQAFNEMTSKFREAQLNLIEQQRLQRELQVAQEIQQMLLPDDFPDVIGYDIASYYQAAKEVGGDLFDVVEVDDQSIGICVADVSGKGVPGSLVMTMIRTALRLEARGNKNPADVLTRVNAFVTDDIRKGMFVTMFYVILDSRERMVSFASAGHNPMILYRGKTRETYYLNPSGFPVGITLPDISLFGEKIQADRIRLHPDDILVLYTDGITEAMNPKRELYGEERFLAAIRKYGHLDVVEFVKSVKQDILAFTGGYEQNDDITLVAIKENMAAVDVKLNMIREMFEQVELDNNRTIREICEEFGISPSTYYRYKKVYEEGGFELLREMFHGYTNLGLRHLSIEIKTKMYDIIREHPEYGPKKISDLLNTEKYGYTKVSPALIYEELKRAKLNTKELRVKFVQRGGKRRLKPPGTPLLTLDGEVMVGFRTEEADTQFPFTPKIPVETIGKEKIISVRGRGIDKNDEKDSAGTGQEKGETAEEMTEASQSVSGDEKNEEMENPAPENKVIVEESENSSKKNSK